MEKKKYVVIGGGWSGLYALKYMLEENLDVRLYERESNIGGVWFYKEKESGVYKSTHVTSSKTYLHASDFPLPDEASNFPKHDQILAYLNDYTNHFNLWSYIHLNTHIIKIEQENNNRWKIKMKINENEIIEIYDGIIIATGQHQTANDLRHIEPFKNFTGTMSHSISYKQPDKDIFVNKTVLIVGGGETASDLAVELSAFTKQIYMSIRNGQWFQDRLFGDQPADILYPRSFSIFGYYNNIVLDIGWNLFIRPFWGEGGTGIDLWKPKSKLFHGFLNKSRDVISKIAFGLVIPKKGIRNINEQLVTFDDDDNKQIHIDHILFCTGYKWLHSFLDENIHQQTRVEFLYDLIFPTNLSNIAFVGSARPVFGSIPSLAELQARRIAQIYSGKAKLPSVPEMNKWLQDYWKRHAKLYPYDHRLKQLVNQFEYTDYLGKQLNVRPNLWKIFFTQPKKWYNLYFESPWSPFLYRLNSIETEEEKLAYQRHLKCRPRKDQIFFRFTKQVQGLFIILFTLFISFFGIIFYLIYKYLLFN